MTDWGAYEICGKPVDLSEWDEASWQYEIPLDQLVAARLAAGVREGSVPARDDRLWDRIELVPGTGAKIEIVRSRLLVWRRHFTADDARRAPIRSVPGGLYHSETLEAGPLWIGGAEKFALRAYADGACYRGVVVVVLSGLQRTLR